MIVYRHQRRRVTARAALSDITRQVEALAALAAPRYEAVVHALIDAGEFASAIADAHAVERDGVSEPATASLDVVVHLARAADAGWHRHGSGAKDIRLAHLALSRCARGEMPEVVERGVSEGFAYYALGPELYADAARAWANAEPLHSVWCVGLRTIGLTLAASAAAALHAEGVTARTCSVRPRGAPFDRRVVLDDQLAAELHSLPGAFVVVIDEGPGISGSSMAGAAEALSRLGIADDRIVLMPAYAPDISSLSAHVQPRWRRHAIHAASFERTWLETRRLADTWRANATSDLAAGQWRRGVHVKGPCPAVNPQHERRKYLIDRTGERAMVKFAGHGRYGAELASRAYAAADAGWSPLPLDMHDGWLAFPWVSEEFGVGQVSADEVSQLGDYLAFIAKSRQTGEPAGTSSIVEMAVVNTRELLSDHAALAVERIRPDTATAAVHVDGRLRPHEWFMHQGRLQKTDGIEHGDDHFYPGPCDIAWDVAGAIEEWRLADGGAAFLVSRYVASSGDRTIECRLPFYRAAYLAFRSAYTAFCRDQLHGTPEGARFAGEHQHYRARLATIVSQLPRMPWPAS